MVAHTAQPQVMLTMFQQENRKQLRKLHNYMIYILIYTYIHIYIYISNDKCIPIREIKLIQGC